MHRNSFIVEFAEVASDLEALMEDLSSDSFLTSNRKQLNRVRRALEGP